MVAPTTLNTAHHPARTHHFVGGPSPQLYGQPITNVHTCPNSERNAHHLNTTSLLVTFQHVCYSPMRACVVAVAPNARLYDYVQQLRHSLPGNNFDNWQTCPIPRSLARVAGALQTQHSPGVCMHSSTTCPMRAPNRQSPTFIQTSGSNKHTDSCAQPIKILEIINTTKRIHAKTLIRSRLTTRPFSNNNTQPQHCHNATTLTQLQQQQQRLSSDSIAAHNMSPQSQYCLVRATQSTQSSPTTNQQIATADTTQHQQPCQSPQYQALSQVWLGRGCC